MQNNERKLQILDLSVTIVLFVVACIIGKMMLMRYDTWVSFNAPAIGVLSVGELIWWRIRKKLVEKNENKYIL